MLQTASAKGVGGRGGAHRALDWMEAWRRVVGVVLRRRHRNEARGRGHCRASPGLLIHRGSLSGACGGVQGLGRPEPHRRRGITVADRFTHGGVRAQFRRCRDWGRGRRPWGDSWSRGEAPAVVGGVWEAVERQVYGGAGASSRRSMARRRS